MSERNCKKENSLLKSAENSDPKPTANSLFHNILRVSPSGSIFCPEWRRPIVHNINKMSILRKQEKKQRISLAARGAARAERTGNRGMSHAPFFPARDPSLRLKSGYAQDDASQENCASLLPSKKGGLRRPPFPKRIPTEPRSQFTPWGAGRAGSGIAGSARPARGSRCFRCDQPCARLLRGIPLRSPTVRQFLAGAQD